MYFPYLRGRQYELLALKELASKNLLSKKIIPIIEPVKLTPTLINTIKEFTKSNHELSIVINPQVGNLESDINYRTDKSKIDEYKKLVSNDIFFKAIIVQNNLEDLYNQNQKNKLICIINNKDFIELYLSIFQKSLPAYTLTFGDRSYTRKLNQSKKIIFEDHFNKKDRNSDYIMNPDEAFSEDHLFYKDEGFYGFADYSIIGSGFQDSGFAPYAVAIHIVYFDNDKSLRIKHFVSQSNDDISNPALKYYEAITELNRWYENEYEGEKTTGLEIFNTHFKEQSYPGLGTVKKLSIMHHLELMSKYLDRQED